jgi:hypothetical protein
VTDTPCHFEQAAEQFLDSISPTVGNLIEHLHQTHTSLTRTCAEADRTPMSLDLARAELAAQRGVQLLVTKLRVVEKYGQLETLKPHNTIRIMFKNFSSLQLFVSGKAKGKKIRQIKNL